MLADSELAEPGALSLLAKGRHNDADLQRILHVLRSRPSTGVLAKIWWISPEDEASDELVIAIVNELLRLDRARDAYRVLDTRLNRAHPEVWSDDLCVVGLRILALVERTAFWADDVEDEGDGQLRDYELARLAARCMSGTRGAEAVRGLVTWMRMRALLQDDWLVGMPQTLAVLLRLHPAEVLDALVLPVANDEERYRLDHFLLPFSVDDVNGDGALASASSEAILDWVRVDPAVRGPSVAGAVPMLKDQEGGPAIWNPMFLAFLEICHDEETLDRIETRFFSGGGWGSIADRYRARRPLLDVLIKHPQEPVRTWAIALAPRLDAWIETLADRERGRDQQFE